MMSNIFKERQLDNLLFQNGYVIVDFIEPGKLDDIRLTTTDLGYGQDNTEKFRRSVNHASVDEKKEINRLYMPLFQPSVDRILDDYKLVRIGVFDKLPGGGPLEAHQHVTLVDESRFTPLGAWVPLLDTTIEMGTLHVIRRSHEIFNNPVRPYNDCLFSESLSNEALERFSTPVELKAGQAIIFHDRLVHWSPPNRTPSIRTAFQLKLLPRVTASELIFYHRVNREEIRKYRIDSTSYQETDLSQICSDNQTLLGTLQQTSTRYTNRQFIFRMNRAGLQKPLNYTDLFSGLLDFLTSAFGKYRQV